MTEPKPDYVDVKEYKHNALMQKAIYHILEGALNGRNVLAPPDKELLLASLVAPVRPPEVTIEEILEVDTSRCNVNSRSAFWPDTDDTSPLVEKDVEVATPKAKNHKS